ncbi:integral peroxisomal membrane peroxin-domain-containing protein [Papiliotrema laurentii]|uniref:Integral peroxisomal membrane peroxin-domain-containing protein n=1 Tax=Papiliotrema laurentii TaxID=5418 RepID=A0AAD9FUP4_PAPLA|nr:integral peroxisomal membrane peroxin-domain-containing protein [Papiliotrema laurentii]
MADISFYADIPGCAIPITPVAVAKAAAPEPKPTASFPPAPAAAPPSRKFSVPTTASLSTNVSDMLLSSLLPPNLPKIPQTNKAGGPGRPRELSTQREALSLPLVSNNFRRFVTKVGPVFWLQDRVEEVLFWRKPKWTWAYLIVWTFIAFNPRILLLLPSATLILVLIHIHEKTHPLPSLLGVTLSASSATQRVHSSPTLAQNGFTATNGPDGEVPVVPPKEAESGVDYYMNLQAIQNLMGQISDIYDYVAPRLAQLSNPSTSPNRLPITTTHLILLLLPPTLFLPLIPSCLMPYLLLPLGYLPPLLFHPNLFPFILALPRHPTLLRLRAAAERVLLTDSLSDDIGRGRIASVEVWENERLDPAIAAKPPVGALPQGAWSSRFLRAGERAPWVKVIREGALWKNEEATGVDKKEGESKMVLALKDEWDFIPGEEWRVDTCGLWADAGADEDGWSYTDDSWQNPAPTPFTEAEATTDKQLPGLALRRITRRRRWWRRVYMSEDDSKRGLE